MLLYTLPLIEAIIEVSSISRFKTGSFLVPSGRVLGSLPYIYIIYCFSSTTFENTSNNYYNPQRGTNTEKFHF